MRYLTVAATVALVACSGSTEPKIPDFVGAWCTPQASSTVYDASVKGWVTTISQNTTSYTTTNGKRVEVRGCVQKGCIKLDPNKTLTAAQAAANCTV